MTYEYRFVYISAIDAALIEGWEPVPHVAHVVAFSGQMNSLTGYVFLRRRVVQDDPGSAVDAEVGEALEGAPTRQGEMGLP